MAKMKKNKCRLLYLFHSWEDGQKKTPAKKRGDDLCRLSQNDTKNIFIHFCRRVMRPLVPGLNWISTSGEIGTTPSLPT